MSMVGAILLLFGGLVGLPAVWNAARPLIDPTRRYSPAWLPAMIVGELAPFWLLVHGAVLSLGLALGGGSNWGGRLGVVMLATSMVLLIWVVIRTWRAVRELRPLVDGPVPTVAGPAKLIGRPVPTPPGVREVLDVPWSDGLTLDLTQPERAERARPVVVYVHGGGWTGGDPQRQGRDLYHALARTGWVTLAIRYPFTPAVSVEHQVEVVRSAIRWARTGLGEHGVDATHVAVAGGSAGGHLAAMAALTPTAQEERVDACVGIYAIYDMANRNRTRAPWAMIRNRVMMQSVEQAPDRYRALSPLDRVTGESPPFLVVHGTRDTLVPIGEADQFVSALRAADRPIDYVPVPGAQHAFDALSTPTTRTVAGLISSWLHATVSAADGARHDPSA